MRIALVASPFISVPPSSYGGTELFIAQLANGLQKAGFDIVVYANGESKLDVEVRWIYERGEWPIKGELYSNLKDTNHTAWAVRDAWNEADIIHLNNVPGLVFSQFDGPQFVYTIHHPHNPELSRFYAYYPEVEYVSISGFQRGKEAMPRIHTIHHGVDLDSYRLQTLKQPYLTFLGRIAPMKGTHIAIEVAKRAGIPLKIAGEVQPIYREYFESQIKPHVDGRNIDYLGKIGLETKNELLGNSLAMLFPIQWDEPFGLVMIEAMAMGTPVLAFAGGAVEEVVQNGVSGRICADIDDMAQQAKKISGTFSPIVLRQYVQSKFSVERMVAEYAVLYRNSLSDFKLAKNIPDVPDDSEESQAIA
jgi:glycosyltransferase involved in cell wall biosynthesis